MILSENSYPTHTRQRRYFRLTPGYDDQKPSQQTYEPIGLDRSETLLGPNAEQWTRYSG